MRTACLAIAAVTCPVLGLGQSCSNYQFLLNGESSFYVTYTAFNAFTQFQASEFPVHGDWGGTANVLVQWTTYTHTSGTPTFGGGGAINWGYEGTVVNFTPAWALTSQVNGHQVPGSCSPISFYMDKLEPEAFIWTTQVVDCATGLFRLVLTDDPNEIGDYTISTRANGANYRLYKDGVLVETAVLATRFVSSPPSFVFDGLTMGRYELQLFSPGSFPAFPYAYKNFGGSWPVFFVPKPGECGTNLAARVMLQGAAPNGGSLMSDALRMAGLVPATEPYSALGYAYAGSMSGASIQPALLTVTGNDAIVDWIIVELRNPSVPTQILYSTPALVQRDGDVMGMDGDPYLSVPLAAGNYRVAFKHRNHLGVMTSNDLPLAAITSWVDVGTGSFYGTSPRAANTFIGSCLWSGDANGDGTLKYTGSANDRDPIILAVGSTTPNNAVSNVYDRRDTNLDGVIKYTGTANDRDIILTNVGSTTPNNTRTQQLP